MEAGIHIGNDHCLFGMGQLQGLKSVLGMVQKLAIVFKTVFPYANNISDALNML